MLCTFSGKQGWKGAWGLLTCSQFGSAKAGYQGTEQGSSQVPKSTRNQVDGAMDDDASYEQSCSPATATPSPPLQRSPAPEVINTSLNSSPAPRISRSPSPATGHNMGQRAGTQISFNYPYAIMQNGFFPGPHTTTAITS